MAFRIPRIVQGHLESEQTAFLLAVDQVRVTNPGDLDRVEKLLDQIDAYEVIASDTHVPEADP